MGTHPIFESDFDCLTEHLIADIYGMSDEEFILDDNYEIDCRRPSDPVPSLVERVGGHKRQATEAAVKDILKPRFQKGESLKCLDGEEVYAAKCLEIDHDGNQWSYLIHYNGWSKTYDEWMFDDDARLNPMKIQSALLRQGSEHTGPLPEARRPEKTKSSDRKPREKRKNKAAKVKQVAKVYFTTEYQRRFRLQVCFIIFIIFFKSIRRSIFRRNWREHFWTTKSL